jgi:hypothetical protein
MPTLTSSLLDHPETTVEADRYPLSSHPAHAAWHALRVRTLAALEHAGTSPSRLNAFARCAGSFWLWKHRHEAAHYLLTRNYCHDRLCQTCASRRAHLIRTNLSNHIQANEFRFITLTLRHTEQPLKQQLARLYLAFRTLRSNPRWKERVQAGIAFAEVGYNVEHDHWHPHLHIVTTGSWYAQHDLSADWLQATGDSKIVDIRFVRDKETVTRYVSKYAVKGPAAAITDNPERFVEYVLAISGRRLVVCFGAAKNWRPLAHRKLDDWQHEGNFEWHVRKDTKDPALRSALLAVESLLTLTDGAIEFWSAPDGRSSIRHREDLDDAPNWLPTDTATHVADAQRDFQF